MAPPRALIKSTGEYFKSCSKPTYSKEPQRKLTVVNSLLIIDLCLLVKANVFLAFDICMLYRTNNLIIGCTIFGRRFLALGSALWVVCLRSSWECFSKTSFEHRREFVGQVQVVSLLMRSWRRRRRRSWNQLIKVLRRLSDDTGEYSLSILI